MHHLNTSSQVVISDTLQLFSKLLSKMVESGILKTYTFLYSENHSYVEKNIENIANFMEDLKVILLKICSHLSPSTSSNYQLMPSNAINNCLSENNTISYNCHNEFSLYSSNVIQETIEQNIQFMTESTPRICDGFSSQDPSNNLKQNAHTIDFSECNSINSLLKEDEQSNHPISYTNQSRDVESLLNVQEPEDLNFSKNVSVNIDQTLERKIDSLSNMKYSNCSGNLYNVKDGINNDFLQSMKFPSAETQNRSINEGNVGFSEHVEYSQCENLQNIDLDVMLRNNERINPNFDRIFDDQFAENESLLESECWNDINLPSAEQMQPNIDIEQTSFELATCSNNLKNKAMATNLENALVSNLNNSLNSSISDTISSDLGNTVATAFDSIGQEEFKTDKYYCEHCGSTFDTKMKLKIHLKRKHNVYLNNINRCDQCGKVFKKRTTLITHIRIHCEIKPFKCPYCWKTFTQKITRDSHIQLHTGMYKFTCIICHKRFPTQAKLNFHSKSHEEPKWRCDICAKMFTTKQYLNVHKKLHNKPVSFPGRNYSCIECNLLFSKKRDLLLHIGESHPEIKFMCYYTGCSRTYTTYKKMKDHIYKNHTTKLPDGNNKPNRFQCTVCKMSFVEKNSFHRHNLLVHCDKIDIENSFNCVHCDKRFATESSLDDHMEKFHNSALSKDMNYSCSICGSLFYTESSLKEHIRIHSDFNTHLCQTCGLVFSEKSNFLIHQSVHDIKKDIPSKKFQCETCDTRFENKMELKQHELDVHDIVPSLEELKPFACTFCDKRFTTRGKCNLHLETHSKDRKYQCSKCDKRFFRRDLLKEHMNTHNGYRAHVCKLCGLAYSQKSSLKVHEATHEKTEETFNCDQCGKLFHSKQALNFHLKTHEGNFRFACEICGKQFVRKCHYDLHLISHSVERPFKCLKCPASYKTSKHLREHSKKAHHEPNLSSLIDSIYDDEVASQQNLLDEYIPSINPLDSELIFSKE